MSKLILNQNIHVVLQEFQEAIREGYRFTPKSDLFTSMSGLNELYLYKSDVEVVVLTHEDAFEKAVVEDYNKQKVLLAVQQLVLSGYEIKPESVLWDSLGTKRIVMFNVEHPNNKVFTKEELEDMDYEELKQIARLRNAFNRSRSVMAAGVLKYQEGGK